MPIHILTRAPFASADPTDALRGHTEVSFRSTSSLCGRFADARRDPALVFQSLKSGVDAGKGYATTGRLLDFVRNRNAVSFVLVQPQDGKEDHQLEIP